VEGDPCSGQPKTPSNPELVDKVSNLLTRDHWQMLKMVESELHVIKELIRSIIITDFGKRMMCMKFVPYNLCDEEELK
jgi:hypothetical protein